MRNLDLNEVYSHEMGPISWSIATAHGNKSLLLEDLEKGVPPMRSAPSNATWIVDGFSSIHVLKEPKKPNHEGEFIPKK